MVIFLGSCMPLEEVDYTKLHLTIENEDVQHILDFQNQQATDSLLFALSSPFATERYWSALAMGSIQDADLVDTLSQLLNDPIPEVQVAAAYSLGQMKTPTAEAPLVAAFNSQDATNPLNPTILEALGKCASEETIKFIATPNTYLPTDTALLVGQAKAIYQAMLRRIIVPEGTTRMLELANPNRYPSAVRLIAANYLMRGANLDLEGKAQDLINWLQAEENPNIQMALAFAAAKTKTDAAFEALMQTYKTSADYRVQCNILRSMRYFDYYQFRDTLFQELKNPNLHIAKTAINVLTNHGEARDANSYRRMARDTTYPPVIQIGLLGASNKNLPSYFADYKGRTSYSLQQQFQRQTDPYLKADAIRAMGYYGRMYNYLVTVGLKSEEMVVRTAALEALKTICEDSGFETSFGLTANRVKRYIGNALLDQMRTGDIGAIALAAGTLGVPERNFKQLFADSLVVLETVLENIPMPKGIEAYYELQKTIDFFKGTTTALPVPEDVKPIDWQILVDAPEKVNLQTTKGSIELQLLPELAPATVASFLELVQTNYYNGKNFHRVVPNFVIQGGCPRGDGYGGLDFALRSELPPASYDQEGYVGMASAGLHTEGVQFFITHSPALHLDGRYTIFAKVTAGMNTVYEIQTGDLIEQLSAVQ